MGENWHARNRAGVGRRLVPPYKRGRPKVSERPTEWGAMTSVGGRRTPSLAERREEGGTKCLSEILKRRGR